MIVNIAPDVSPEMQYHLERNILISENVFRYGSEAWGKLVCEAREMYSNGLVDELDSDEYYLIESDAGIMAEFEGKPVMLDTPEPVWDKPGFMQVYVNSKDGVKQIEYGDL